MLLRHLLACAFALLLWPLVSPAQPTGSISGVVVDETTRAPLVSATVLVYDLVDTAAPALGARTGTDGGFLVKDVTVGRTYVVEVSYLGYESGYIDSIRVAAPGMTTAGTIGLTPAAVGVDGVTVREKRPDVRVTADKTVYAIEDNPSYTATNVSELLGQVPGISVDQDGNVSLRGSGDVVIMMNDRPLTMPEDQRNKFLQNLPAEVVHDIEIRTNPGARFDARSQGGIINIVTRRTMRDMLGGNVNSNVDTRVGGGAGGNFYLNGSELSASLGGGMNAGPWIGDNSSLQENYLDSVERRIVGTDSYESDSRSWHLNGQLDYKFTPADLVSLSFSMNNWSSSNESRGAQVFYNAAGAVVRRSYDTSAPTDANGGGGWTSASLLFKHEFGEEHSLKLDVTADGSGFAQDALYSTTFLDSAGAPDSVRSTLRRSLYDRSGFDVITTLDYDNPLSDVLTVSLGARTEINRLDNLNDLYERRGFTAPLVLDTLQSKHYLPRNVTYGFYGNVSYRFSEALGGQVGLRLERAEVSGRFGTGEEIPGRTFTNLFPSGSLSLTVDTVHTIALSYRRSVALPDIDALDPTPRRWGDRNEYSGNPDLQPEFTNRFELNYSTFWQGGNMVSVGTYFSHTTGSIEQSQTLVGIVNRSRPENFNGYSTVGLEASLSWRPVQWLNLRLGGQLYQTENRGSSLAGDLPSTATGGGADGWLNIDPIEGMTISASLYMQQPARTGASKSNGFYFSSLNIRQKLFDEKLTLSLRFSDPLGLQKWEYEYATPEFRTWYSGGGGSRYVGLTVSYAFGTTPRMEDHRQERTERKGRSNAGGGGGGGQGGGGQ